SLFKEITNKCFLYFYGENEWHWRKLCRKSINGFNERANKSNDCSLCKRRRSSYSCNSTGKIQRRSNGSCTASCKRNLSSLWRICFYRQRRCYIRTKC